MTPERRIQKAIMEYLWAVGIFAWTNSSMGVYDPTRRCFRTNKDKYKIKGTSDIIGILPSGRFLGIEVKTAKGVISPEQREFIANIEKRGGVAFVARSVDDVRRWLGEKPGIGKPMSEVTEGLTDQPGASSGVW